MRGVASDTVDPKILCKRLSSREFNTVNSLGVNPISPTADNFVGLVVQTVRQNCMLLVR